MFDAYLSDPHVAIQEWNIRVRATFTWMEKDKPQPLPIFIWQHPDKARMETIQRLSRSFRHKGLPIFQHH
jgi:hypothetical protein